MSRINYARLTINTNNLSDDIISSIKRNKSLSIYSGVQKNVLIDLVKIIKNINGFKLVIILEDSNLINNSINGLDILEFLPSINHLHILVHQTTPLLNIDALEYVDNLRTFSVSGNLNKNIDFSPLRKFVRLSSLHINDLIFSDKYYDIINNNPIESLSLRKISLSHLNEKSSIKNLEDITHIYNLKKLKNLAITFSKVDFESIINIFSKMSLHNFYFLSSKNKENEIFDKLTIEHKVNNSAM